MQRFHDRVLPSLRQVRNALRYVLNNHLKHMELASSGGASSEPDWFSSRRYFDGWAGRAPDRDAGAEGAIVAEAEWKIRSGWKRCDAAIGLDEVPARLSCYDRVMTAAIEFRESAASDFEALDRLYPAAFPGEDLLPLVHQLSSDAEGVLSLVATLDGCVVGHVVFTRCGLSGTGDFASLLGPLAVDPAHQGVGIGSALVREGLARVRSAGAVATLVLGDPAYYSRFGFDTESEVAPPYALPAEWTEAWQSLHWMRGAERGAHRLVVPAPWKHRALWSS